MRQLPKWTVGWSWGQFVFGWMRFYHAGYHDVFHVGFLQIEIWH